MHWVVAYDFASHWFSPSDWLFATLPFVFVAIGIFLLLRAQAPGSRIMGLFVGAAGLYFGVRVTLLTLDVYHALSDAYDARTYRVAEGVVE